MAEIISSDDLVSYLPGTTLSAETAALYVRLANGLVSRVGDGAVGDLVDTLAAEEEVPEGIVAITLEVAARGARRSGPTSVTTSFDQTSRTVRHETTREATRRGVYLTKDERDDLLRAVGKTPRRRPRVGTIRLGAGRRC